MNTPSPQPAHDRASNVTLWLVFAATALGVDGFFLWELHHGVNRDSALAWAGLLARTAFYVAGGLLIEALLMRAADGFLTLSRTRRLVLHAYWVGVMLLCVALVVDLLVFAFAGYHLPTAFRILFADGPEGVGKVVEATGLSLTLVAGSVAGLLLGLLVAAVLSKYSRRVSLRAGLIVPRGRAIRAVLISMGVLSIVEMAGIRLRNPFLWEREIRRVPLAFSIARPDAALASFRVAVQPPPLAPPTTRGAKFTPTEHRPDIFIIIVESLRSDQVVPETMPQLALFSRSSWTFEHALTTGNVTHYSWYGLLCSRYPIFFQTAKATPEAHGSLPFLLLRERGYQLHLYATPDTEYQKLESIVFGPAGELLTTQFHPSAARTAERDQRVIAQLGRQLAAEPPGNGVYVVALDSSHFGYEWGAEFVPPFTPYAEDISIARNYELDAPARLAVIQRYRNSVAWVDQLLGQLFNALKSSGRLDNSVIVVTGDHGEAFWEHGAGTHGSDLGREQLEVGFALRLPGRPPQHFQSVFSLLDVMPTVLEEVGITNTGLDGIAVQQRIPTSGARGTGAPGEKEIHVLAPRGALTFQGWNERTFRFALSLDTRRMLFELDNIEPLASRRLVLKDVTDVSGTSLVDGEDRDVEGAYQSVMRNLPAIMDSMPFLKF